MFKLSKQIGLSVLILLFLTLGRRAHASDEFLDKMDDDDGLESRESSPIPTYYMNDGTVSLHAEYFRTPRIDNVGTYSAGVMCRVNNYSGRSIQYLGYGLGSPWYRIQFRDSNETHTDFWAEHNVGWFCGTGLYEPVLRPETSAVFWVVDLPRSNPLRLRIGLDIAFGQEDKRADAIDMQRQDRTVGSHSDQLDGEPVFEPAVVWTDEIILSNSDYEYVKKRSDYAIF